MITPTTPNFKEPTTRGGRSRVTIADVAKAGAKTRATTQLRNEHDEVLKGFVSENPQSSSFYDHVPFDGLVVDHSIQRAENPFEVAAIAREFNPDALGMITLSRRIIEVPDSEPDVELIVIDGQQRRAAALKVGYEGLVHAHIFDGLTRADEARLFRQLNYRKSVSQIALFRAALVEENPEALMVIAILNGLGIPFGTSKGYMGASAGRRLVKRKNGATHLHWALSQAQRLYDRGSGGVYDSNLIEALFLLHERYGNRINETRLYDKLASDEGSNAGIMDYGQTLKRVHKVTSTIGIVMAITDRYNHGLGKSSRNALPEWGSA